MSFNSIVFTDKGRALKAKAEAGVNLVFTKMAMGSGELSGRNPNTLNALIDLKVNMLITEIIASSNNATISGNFTNEEITTGFYWREIGVYATDPDLGEILYCYGNAANQAEFIPAYNSSVVEKVINLKVIIGNATNVSATIEHSLAFATKVDVAMMDDKIHGFESQLQQITINVKSFGANGDGATDDTVSIQNAIDYAYENSNYTLYFPMGTYIITKNLIMNEKMVLRGENRESAVIHKITNTVSDNPKYNMIDAVLILDKSDNYERTYTERQAIKGIELRGNRTSYVAGNNQYGVYSSLQAPFFLAEDYRISGVDIGVYLYASWHSTFNNGLITAYKRVLHVATESQGIRINNLDCFASNEICVDLSGTNYGSINTLNMEYIRGTALKLNHANMMINGMAIEWSTDNVNRGLHLFNSDVVVMNSFFNTNKLDPTYRTFYLQGSSLEVNNSSIGYADAGKVVKGRMFEMTINSCIKINDTNSIDCMFEENSVIGDASNSIQWNKVKQVQKNIFLGEYEVGVTYSDRFANPNPNYISKKITLDNKYDPLYSEGNATDRGYDYAYNKGDWALINNPLKNGHAAYICARDNKKVATLLGTITAVNGGTITVADLTLDTFETEGSRLYRTLDLKTSSGGIGWISSIDYNAKTISLGSISGTWAIGDTISTTVNNYLRKTDWAIVPVIMYGTTSKRPLSPVIGQSYFDVTLGKPVWCKQNYPSVIWVDATGTTL